MQNVHFKRLFAALLAALCALLPPLPALSEAAPAAIVPSAIEDDGVVRVYLRSLDAPQQLTLTLDGVYTVEHDAGFRFDRGARIALSDSPASTTAARKTGCASPRAGAIRSTPGI